MLWNASNWIGCPANYPEFKPLEIPRGGGILPSFVCTAGFREFGEALAYDAAHVLAHFDQVLATCIARVKNGAQLSSLT